MSIPASNPIQIEFAQIFEQLAKEFKFTKADVARSLSIERSYVSMILNGQRKPSIRILEAMRGLENGLRAGGDQNGLLEDGELSRVFQQLKTLKERDEAAFQVVKKLLEILGQDSSKSTTSASPKKTRAA